MSIATKQRQNKRIIDTFLEMLFDTKHAFRNRDMLFLREERTKRG